MKFGVVTFPGSNCDQDMVYTLETMLDQKVEKLWHKDHDLKGVDFVILPGGFSYGDYLRSGAIASFSPIMQEVIDHANKGGYVMGICNGYQILTETHLLDGALLHNDSQKFICKNVFLKPISKTASITADLDFDKVYKIPIAHGEGRFYASDDELKRLEDNDQILFKYASESGVIDDASNPNGSCLNIAGTTNKNKNVFGMMPHPERAVDPNLGNVDGRAIFMSLLKQFA
ncbi:MAG: phosphoribosylformylglycinamidine synthase subunit PurQ [Putridiphycobacter sp.]|jgi:phosphoribosylformylglycinamidine synthase I|nr:phosphoribosylformylglycinamidine synthase subunit PurQ [Putridiphycobacter sp.]